MADVIPFRRLGDDERASERLRVLLDGEKLMPFQRAHLGSLEEWAWTAVTYLKVIQSEMAGTGRTLVSVPAIAVTLAYLEELAGRLDVIPVPPSDPEAA